MELGRLIFLVKIEDKMTKSDYGFVALMLQEELIVCLLSAYSAWCIKENVFSLFIQKKSSHIASALISCIK